jgi:hypothetical protein
MPISEREALEIARRFGLKMSDADFLSRVAEDVDDAKKIAGEFGKSEDDLDAREIVKRIPR